MTTTYHIARNNGVRERLDITSNLDAVPFLFTSNGKKYTNLVLPKHTAVSHVLKSAADPNAEVYRQQGNKAVRLG